MDQTTKTRFLKAAVTDLDANVCFFFHLRPSPHINNDRKPQPPRLRSRSNSASAASSLVAASAAMPRHQAALILIVLMAAMGVAVGDRSQEFADDLEKCVRDHAAEAVRTLPTWADVCLPPTEKIDKQAAVYERTLATIYEKWGYPGALWCAFYSVRMTGKEFNPNSDQPNNPNFADWYASLVCPWNVETCGREPLGRHGEESRGVSAVGAPNMNAQYMPIPKDDYVQDEPDRRTMSCGLCGHLLRRLGKPPYKLDPPPIDDPGREHLYTANWDFHPFGAWLANVIAPKEGVMRVVRQINIWKASNGEEIHGFLWQSTRLLAYDTGQLSGTRKYNSHEEMSKADVDAAEDHVMKVCEPSWSLAPQSRDDCSHAAGHGFFYTFLDIGQAVQSCWSDKIVLHTPCGSMPPRPPSGVDPDEWECTRACARGGATCPPDAPKDKTNPCTQYGVAKGCARSWARSCLSVPPRPAIRRRCPLPTALTALCVAAAPLAPLAPPIAPPITTPIATPIATPLTTPSQGHQLRRLGQAGHGHGCRWAFLRAQPEGPAQVALAVRNGRVPRRRQHALRRGARKAGRDRLEGGGLSVQAQQPVGRRCGLL